MGIYSGKLPRSFARKQGLVLAMAMTTGLLAGCAAGDALLNHRELEVETHMSESVFLDPVPPTMKTIYMSARNTSDHPDLDVRAPLAAALTARGYAVTDDPNHAHYMLRINVLQAGKVDADDPSALLASKYGEPLAGAAVGVAASNAMGGGGGAALGLGLVAGVGTAVANSMYKNILMAVVIDIQLSERPLSGAKVKTTTDTKSSQSNSSGESSYMTKKKGSKHTVVTEGSNTSNSRNVSQSLDEEKDFKQYQIREVAYAEKANLKFEEATPLLITKLTSTLSNLFE